MILNTMSDKFLLDVGSRLGAVLYGVSIFDYEYIIQNPQK